MGLSLLLSGLAWGILKAYEAHLNSRTDGRRLLAVEFRFRPTAWGLGHQQVRDTGPAGGPIASFTRIGPLRVTRILPDGQPYYRIEGQGDQLIILR